MSQTEFEQKPNVPELLLRYAEELKIRETEEMEKLRGLFAVSQDNDRASIAGQYQDIAQRVADQSPSPALTHNILVSVLYSSQRAPDMFGEAIDDAITVSVNEDRNDIANRLSTIQALL